MHYFWWRNRLLYLSRNKMGCQKIVLSEGIKCFKLAFLKSLQQLFTKADTKRAEKARRYRAGCLGILHYFLGRFGNCPKRLLRRKSL